MKKYKQRKAFTLIELLASMVMIGILATFAINTYMPSTQKAYASMMKVDMANFSLRMLETYNACGMFPGTRTQVYRPSKNGIIAWDVYNINSSACPASYSVKQQLKWSYSPSYELYKYTQGACSSTGKAGFTVETWLNRLNASDLPILYGKYNSCDYAHPRVWSYNPVTKVYTELKDN